MEKKLDGNYARMLRAILNMPLKQHPTKKQLYGHLPPITKTIKVRLTRHAGHCWRSKDELIRDLILWTPSHGRKRAAWQARTYIQQLCADTGWSLEDPPGAVDDRERWWEMFWEIRACSMTGWWWWSLFSIISIMNNVAKHWHFYCGRCSFACYCHVMSHWDDWNMITTILLFELTVASHQSMTVKAW